MALVFASLLIGLRGTVVGDLPKLEKQFSLDDYMNAKPASPTRVVIKEAGIAERDANSALPQTQLKCNAARTNSTAAHETYNNWLAARRAEQLPDTRRREESSYDTALTRLSKGVCPGCECAVDFKNTGISFCPHCGIGLSDHCGRCSAQEGFCQVVPCMWTGGTGRQVTCQPWQFSAR